MVAKYNNIAHENKNSLVRCGKEVFALYANVFILHISLLSLNKRNSKFMYYTFNSVTFTSLDTGSNYTVASFIKQYTPHTAK